MPAALTIPAQLLRRFDNDCWATFCEPDYPLLRHIKAHQSAMRFLGAQHLTRTQPKWAGLATLTAPVYSPSPHPFQNPRPSTRRRVRFLPGTFHASIDVRSPCRDVYG